jgi:hypothetical protein
VEDDKPETDGLQSIPLSRSPASDITPLVEDYSDLATEEDEQLLQKKVADFKVRHYRSLKESVIELV